ncbi:hypothetical protein Cgig2_024029 [Carnegiea gigantea]|uniref:Uncharacterized protein n=1 Tax=Carnegiea gigantea TaxID=171969 RepID=A0A9Q1QLI6_9CARY|nr:hypothetical protein Cgig2_024029 [Carnegiea gigantea]
MNATASFGKYLGVPVLFVNSIAREFNFLIEKVQRKRQDGRPRRCGATYYQYIKCQQALSKKSHLWSWLSFGQIPKVSIQSTRLKKSNANKCLDMVRIHSKPQLLLEQLYRGKYGTHSPIDTTYYDCKEKNVSRGRKCLVIIALKFKEALRWQICNEHTARVLENRWCCEQDIQLRPQIDQPIAALFNTSHTAWDLKNPKTSLPPQSSLEYNFTSN